MSDTKGDPWDDLLKALPLLAKHRTGDRPFHCEHDELSVMSNPSLYTTEELAQLDEWGFFGDEDAEYFTSFRFGSA